jgi:hypothetical protein
MGNREVPDEVLAKVSEEKRGFLKKIITGTAFAIPVIMSFSMDDLRLKVAYGSCACDGRGGECGGGEHPWPGPGPGRGH